MNRENEPMEMSRYQGPHFLDPPSVEGGHASLQVPGSPLPAWEEVSAGRFMPRRVRGSYLGRALG